MLRIPRNNFLIILISIVLISLTSAQTLAKGLPEIGENEIKLGNEAVTEVNKEYKLIDDAELLKRVREIGEKLAAIANTKEIPAKYGTSQITPFKYTFNIVDDKDVNAFSLPGGHIYVHKGLLDFVQSEQELAGVIAHEVVHASHHHMVYLIKTQAGLKNQVAIALLAAMLAGSNSDIGNVLMGVQLYQIAKLNGYGLDAERDADNAAVYYMHEAGYNPVGLLTFLERLAKQTELVDYGIYRNHPQNKDRVRATLKAIESLGLPINRRQTTNAICAKVRVDKVNDTDVPGVALGDTLIYRPAPANGKTSAQIAQEVSDKINAMLDTNIQMHELRIDKAGAAVIARNSVIIAVSDEDAALMGKSASEVASIAGTTMRDVIWKEMVDTIH